MEYDIAIIVLISTVIGSITTAIINGIKTYYLNKREDNIKLNKNGEYMEIAFFEESKNDYPNNLSKFKKLYESIFKADEATQRYYRTQGKFFVRNEENK